MRSLQEEVDEREGDVEASRLCPLLRTHNPGTGEPD
jgi:hypothetical protein